MSITVGNQTLVGNTVSIASVSMPGPGTLAIFESDAAGGPSLPPIGFVSLQLGDYHDILVALTSIPKPGDKLIVVLERPGSYVDPYMENGKPLNASFQIL